MIGSVKQHSEASFYFVQISDTHLGNPSNEDRTVKIIHTINNLPFPVKCVVHTGDITEKNIDRKEKVLGAVSLFDRLKFTVHFVPGNHDILVERPNSTVQAFKTYFGELNSRAEYENVEFLFVCTLMDDPSFTNSKQPLSWLEAALQKSGRKPVIICHHNPSIYSFSNNEFRGGWPMETKSKWELLVNSYNVKAIIAGHHNMDQHDWIGNVPVYVSPPINNSHGRQASFRIYHYHDGKIAYWTVALKPPKSIHHRIRDKTRRYFCTVGR